MGLRVWFSVWLVLTCLALGCGRALADGTKHVIQQAQSGAYDGELSYLVTSQTQSYSFGGKTTHYVNQTYGALRVSVFRSGQLLFSQVLNCKFCEPLGSKGIGSNGAIHFAQLEQGSARQLVADFYTGGAHCCDLSYVFVPSGSSVRALQHLWGDPGYRLVDLDHNGLLEFETADDRFAYAFTDFADSDFPVQLWKLRGSTLVDVTRSYPAIVRSDAARTWAGYLRARRDATRSVRGILAAWAADEALLGKWNQAYSALQAARASGYLDQGFTMGVTGSDGSASNYITALHQFLIKNSYLSS